MKKITLLLLLSVSVSFSQTFDKAKLDSYFDALEKNDAWMGSVALSRNGAVIYTRSVGFSDVQDKQKASAATRYHIGSISKTFTGVLVFKAIEEKKLSLDDNLSKWFPQVPNADRISVRMLLSHRTGIHNFTDDESYLTWHTQAKTEAQMLEVIVKGGSDFAPDSTANYSNSNYTMLAYILEKVNKKPFAQLLKDKILVPLKLNDIVAEGRIDGRVSAQSYTYDGNWVKMPETDLSITIGAGSIVATASDLARFFDALFDGKLVSDASLITMETVKDNYGMSLFSFPFNGRTGFGHTGGIDGFSSLAVHFDDGDVTAVRLSNGANYPENDISIALLAAAYGGPYDLPKIAAKTDVSGIAKGYAGTYATPAVPLKITIRDDNGKLFAKATGQSEFPLAAQPDGSFTFEPASIKIMFRLDERQMMLYQGGGSFLFTKE